jgi:hypothetical protein
MTFGEMCADGVVLRELIRGAKVLRVPLARAAIPNSEATNFACPCASLPANLLTCPFLIMFIASPLHISA